MPEPKSRRDETLIKAIVRAHRWRRSIESGQARSITDVAEQEGVTDAYVCRLLPLTCLAPDIVEATWTGGSRRLRPKCGLVLVGVLVRDAERPLARSRRALARALRPAIGGFLFRQWARCRQRWLQYCRLRPPRPRRRVNVLRAICQ